MYSDVFPEIKAIYQQAIVWFTLGSQDIKLRYRRSILGPLWITISMAITIYSMSFLYGRLFNIEISTYLPYLASGIIGWAFISALIIESGQVFIEAEGYIRNQESYISTFMMRLIIRNILIFLHNSLVFIPIIFFLHLPVNYKLLLLIPGILIIAINAFFYGTVLAIIATRYRDFAQIVSSLIQIIFFITPVMWMSKTLGNNMQWVVKYNPFAYFLNLIRAPLLATSAYPGEIFVIFWVTILGLLLYTLLLSKYKYRIVFWL